MNLISTRKITEMPVNDVELERKILKTILLSKNNLGYLDILTEEDFYNESNRKVYKSFCELVVDGSIDPDLLPDSLRRSSEFTNILVSEPLFNYKLLVYINKLQQLTQQRKIQRMAYNATIKVKENKSAAEIANWLAGEISNLKLINTKENIEEQNMRINTELLDELQKDDYFGLTSGYPTLDFRIRGFANGTMTILGGTPSVGKSTWLLNIVNHLCKKGKKVLHVNLEMSHLMLQMKMLSIVTGLSTSALMATRKNLTDENWKEITDALNMMSAYKWYRIGEKEITAAVIDNTIKEQGGFDILIVDYLQLISPVVHKKSRYEDVSTISRDLKKLATKYNIPVIVVASINRDYAMREDKMPAMSDLRDSGNIEYDADLILFITRRSLFEEHNDVKHGMDKFEFEHHAELLIAKNRWGFANRKIEFYFDGEKSLFKEVRNADTDGKS